jgi:hypothetical protein
MVYLQLVEEPWCLDAITNTIIMYKLPWAGYTAWIACFLLNSDEALLSPILRYEYTFTIKLLIHLGIEPTCTQFLK